MARVFARLNAHLVTRSVGAEFGRTKGKLSSELEKGISDTAEAVKRVYRFWAPRKSGRLQKGIGVRKSGRARIDITAAAADPNTGYDYVGVTRFGHRVERIQPKNNLVLRLNLHGGFWTFAPEVKGYDPDFDWAEEALHSAQDVAAQHATRLSQRLELRLVQ